MIISYFIYYLCAAHCFRDYISIYLYISIYRYLYIILVTGMAFTNCNSHLDLLFQKGIRYKHHHENFQESLANELTY